ncbi:mannose-1-phosphate guanylyltransferase/mannose-6-phosphate isomerase [Methylophilaceae bacterium]|nr:mannose-1-phosphate guanylyltransferase/mannose-6-phosphate isomerase [Methylophilaceae bacterium]
MKITPVILCGGSGTRLWPLSRQHYPKQFLKLVGDSTLFQQSIGRAIALQNKDIQIEEILIVTNENHRFLVLEQLDELKLKIPVRILLEPEPKNTAPALTLAALAAEDTSPDSVLAVTPADHYVKNLHQFTQAIHAAIKAVQDKVIVTLGINPSRPDTGFGYIHYEGDDEVKHVLTFKEKPDLKTAQQMIDQGQHAWNGGMFILQSKTWLDAIQQSNPEIANSLNKAWKNKNTDQWFERPDSELFSQSPSDSIDYAVMEKSKELGVDVKLLVLDAGWSDLGSFDALDEIEDKDKDGNIFKGDVVSLNTKNTITIASKKNISLLGVENLIVIETADSVLVANKNDAQSIKELVKLLGENHQYLLSEHTKVNRPWGWFETIEEGDSFKIKRIQINPGKSISLQRHEKRSEHWVVVQGKATVQQDNKEYELNHNESTYIQKKQVHRLSNNSNEILQIIEVQSGEYLGEDDIERLEDQYGR